jgi:hypothetical protein
MSIVECLIIGDFVLGAIAFLIFSSRASREARKQGKDPLSAAAYTWAVGATGRTKKYRDLAFASMILSFLVALAIMALLSER